MKKTINLLGIIVVSMIICLTQASCIVFGGEDETRSYFKIVNNYDLPITYISISFIEKISYDGYIFDELNIPKGKSETYSLEPYDKPYNAEVNVFFGDMYSIKELRFNPGKTTTATLNEDGILE